MSRSRKKHGIVKDKGLRRAEYNRRLRRVNKQKIKEGKDPLQMRELINPWDVCDWVFFWYEDYYKSFNGRQIYEDEEIKKMKRKFFSK